MVNRSNRSSPRRRVVTAAAAVLAGLAVGGCDVQDNADLDRGRQLFAENCGRCHALTEAGTSSEIGPDLDAAFAVARSQGSDSDAIEGVVEYQIAFAREVDEDDPTYMPKDLVTGDDARDVAAYVASVAGVPGIKAPVFEAQEYFITNCGSCHQLAAAGTAGNIGPDLDEVLPGQAADMIAESIVEPSAELSPGFGNNMPANFGDALEEENLNELVQYLIDSTGGGKGKQGSG